jgi:hypothetical protein
MCDDDELEGCDVTGYGRTSTHDLRDPDSGTEGADSRAKDGQYERSQSNMIGYDWARSPTDLRMSFETLHTLREDSNRIFVSERKP